jgi:regulator of sigma E protease
MTMLGNGLQTILAFLLALFLLILVHEWGHFWVARRVGIKVLRFSIGMGKPIWSIRRGPDQTEWAIAAFPFGGYVRMLDEREGPVDPHEVHRAFNRQTLARRAAVVSAGPAANFLMALLLYWGMYLVGIPGFKPYIAEPPSATPAARAGFQAGERIVRMGGHLVRTWSEVQLLLVDESLNHSQLEIETQDDAGHLNIRHLDLTQLDLGATDSELADRVGLKPWEVPIPPRIGKVLPGGVGARSGLQPGDQVLAIDGKPVASWAVLVDAVRASPGKPLQLQLERNGQTLTLALVPESTRDARGGTIGKIGVAPEFSQRLVDRYWTTVRYGPWDALREACGKTWEVTRLTFKTFGMMLTGTASWKNIGGPIQIADYAGQTAKMGAIPYFTFLALISISLGALNLLPIPLLDGGHLMYYVVEFIKGSPVSERVLAVTQRVGLMLLAALMGFALYNDIHRLITN